jgi:hypothetical protein
MALEKWGPLAGLIGRWESGYDGRDVSFHNAKGKLAETPFREEATYSPVGPVGNGDQELYGLNYTTAAFREGDDSPFHTETGYWMWDAAEQQVMRCFMMPGIVTLIAGATVAPDATSFTLQSVTGSNVYGILSNPHLDRIAKCVRFDVTTTIGDGIFSYDETSMIEYQLNNDVIMHTDRNTLTRISRKV